MLIEQRKYTLEQYHAFCDQPDHRDRLFELIDGEIVEKMPSFRPSQIAMKIGRHLGNYLDQNPLGYVTGPDGGYILAPGMVLIPDVAFISRARLPELPEREAHAAPELAVEVKSPTDSKRELRRKAELYLARGTQILWLVFPEEGRVEVYTPDTDVTEIGMEGTLDGGTVLPGFSLAVKTLLS